MTLVECIPNVSEGRRSELVDAIAETFRHRPDVRLLHVHADVDHNRSVFTVVGDVEAMPEAIEALYEVALSDVDMRSHHGAHPRIGAVDVCPFVPLPDYGTSMADCIELAHALGERVGRRFELPVFLYRKAASSPLRRNLATIRRGQFEGLADKLLDPDWRPDYGPAVPHPSGGATIIGARDPLIAYNMLLDTADVGIAREIAASVRASSGGLPGIRALGVALASRGHAQVSMNIEDPLATPLETVSEAVRAGAAVRGASVIGTELVGLIPKLAVTAAAQRWLERGEFTTELVLENAIEASGINR